LLQHQQQLAMAELIQNAVQRSTIPSPAVDFRFDC
jgi:hypothetical protein